MQQIYMHRVTLLHNYELFSIDSTDTYLRLMKQVILVFSVSPPPQCYVLRLRDNKICLFQSDDKIPFFVQTNHSSHKLS